MDARNPRGLGGIIDTLGGVANDVQDLVRGEVGLARAEFDEKLHRLIAAAVWLLGGALLAFAGLVVLLEGAAASLAFELPAWASLLIVGGVIIVVGAFFALAGMKRMSLKTLAPERTAKNLQKDAALVRGHTS